MKDRQEIITRFIAKKSEKLHEQIGAIVDAFIINENLGEDAVTLNCIQCPCKQHEGNRGK